MKKMNSSPVTAQSDYDYRFIVYLINDVFGKDCLVQSGCYRDKRKHKYKELNEEKLRFIEGMFIKKNS